MARKDDDKKDDWLSALGQSICERRAEISMTQQQLAELSGVHRTYISDIERGSRNVTVTTANKIAGAMNMTTSMLFDITDAKVRLLHATLRPESELPAQSQSN